MAIKAVVQCKYVIPLKASVLPLAGLTSDIFVVALTIANPFASANIVIGCTSSPSTCLFCLWFRVKVAVADLFTGIWIAIVPAVSVEDVGNT